MLYGPATSGLTISPSLAGGPLLLLFLACFGPTDAQVAALIEEPEEVVAWVYSETDSADGETWEEWDGDAWIYARRGGLVASVQLYHALCPSLLDSDLATEAQQVEVSAGHSGADMPVPVDCGGDGSAPRYWGSGSGLLSVTLDVEPVPLSETGIDDDSCLPSEATELVATWQDLVVAPDDGLDEGGEGDGLEIGSPTWTARVEDCGLLSMGEEEG